MLIPQIRYLRGDWAQCTPDWFLEVGCRLTFRLQHLNKMPQLKFVPCSQQTNVSGPKGLILGCLLADSEELKGATSIYSFESEEVVLHVFFSF